MLESLKEITVHYIGRRNETEKSPMAEDLKDHSLMYAGMTMGVEYGPGETDEASIKQLCFQILHF